MNCLLFFYWVNELFALPLYDLLNQPLQIHIDTSIDGRGARTTRGCSDSCRWRFPHALRRCLGEKPHVLLARTESSTSGLPGAPHVSQSKNLCPII
ncbi:hypothetical protein AMTRI_Chr08g206050 [Amborella trichopoda]